MNAFLEIHNEDGSVDDLFVMVEVKDRNSYVNITELLDKKEFYHFHDGVFKILENEKLPVVGKVYQKTPWYEAISICGSIPCTDGAIITEILEYNPERKIVKTAQNQWWHIRNTAYSHSLSRLAKGDTVITNNIKTIRAGLYARDSIPDYSDVQEGVIDQINFSSKDGQHTAVILWNNGNSTEESLSALICVKKYNGQILLPVYFSQKETNEPLVKKFKF